jgi:putative mRNA 3-end processing factor
VLSDHADWNDLNTVVKETGAEKIFVTHGYTDTYARWLSEQGIDAAEVSTQYGNEEEGLTENV